MKKTKLKKAQTKMAGFSLLELLIAMFIFVLIITVSISVFAGVILARQKNREMQRNLEEARTAMETMAKNIRMSSTLAPGGTSDEITMFNNSQGQCITYKFDANVLKVGMSLPPGNTTDPGYPDCSSKVADEELIPAEITGSFTVIETDNDETDGSTPLEAIGKATISMTIGSGYAEQHMQTTVSFRDYQGILY